MENLSFKNIIFDLGGVILNIDTQLTFDALEKLGLKNTFQEENEAKELFFNLEKGLSTPLELRKFIRKISGVNHSDEEIDAAWTAMLLDIPVDRVEYISDLKKNYRLFLLSNTNEIHKIKFHREFEENFGYPINQLFEKNHYSHEMGLRKPDPAIFLQVLKENDLAASETLFIDDVEENVLAAESVGIIGLKIIPGSLLESLPAYLSR
jgi:putative hydrolase of the HAD superfamily